MSADLVLERVWVAPTIRITLLMWPEIFIQSPKEHVFTLIMGRDVGKWEKYAQAESGIRCSLALLW